MKLKRFVLPLAIVAGLLMANACSDSDYRKANRAAKQIADDLHEFEAQVEQQYLAKQTCKQTTTGSPDNCFGLDGDEAANLAQLASQATFADDTFISRVKALKTLDASNSAQVVVWFQEMSNAVKLLNDQGVLHIKNKTARDHFDLIYQSLQTGLSTLSLLLQKTSGGMTPSSMPPIQRAGMEFDAATLALTLAAFNSLANLIVKARADGALTDEQLQQAALDENADTRNHAALFIKSLESPPQ